MQLERHLQLLAMFSYEKRREALNVFLSKPYTGSVDARVARLSYNARLFTAMRRAGVWPPPPEKKELTR